MKVSNILKFNLRANFKATVSFVVFILTLTFPFAEENSKDATNDDTFSVPYPNRSIYVRRGIVGSLGFGIYHVEKYKYEGKSINAGSLFQWQGEGSFYYLPFLSGGVSSKIIAGEPFKNSALVDNRYMTFVRVHKNISQMAFFAGPTIGLHHQTLETDSTEETVNNLDLSIPTLRYGLELGSGINVNHAMGLTMGCEIEHSLAEELLIRYSGGVTLNLLYLWPHIGNLTKAFYLVFEYKFAQVEEFSVLDRESETMYMLGSSIAF